MDGTRRRILIIDDNMELAQILSLFLEDQGHQTAVARDGRTGIEKMTSELPELVLLDLFLPDMHGGEVLKKIREADEDAAIIVITGHGGEQTAVDLMKAGAIDFLSKPIDQHLLVKAIKDALKIRDARIEDKRHNRLSPLEKFFPFLAHEIRNPLHAIGGALAIIQRRSNLKDPLLAQSIKIIQEEVHHLNEFVQECLNFVRPPTRSHFDAIDLHEVILVVMPILSHMFEDLVKKTEVIVAVDPDLPRVQANYEEMKQVFLNILKNSFEAMDEGGELTIKAAYEPAPFPGWVRIVFSDNGPGVRKEETGQLFSPFFTTKIGGTGLGLAVCHRIITERHRGKIYIASEEGRGTTVTVELPVSQTTEGVEEVRS